ncbi:MAG TPA: sulfatase-like hydrolase/transferase [Bacteroidales bacterium]|nr:sulfatase-like hydrolase/transferase [Bacteroidales bacterium]
MSNRIIKGNTCILSVSALLFYGGVSCSNIGEQERPNIILIFTDQQNSEALGIAGNKYVRTPNMDRLAQRGIRFTQAYCTSPVSGPSRSSIVTGMMPCEAGVVYNGDSLKSDVINVGEIFREAGYNTVWGGKWHLPESYPQRAAAKPGEKKIRGFEVLPFYDPEKEPWMLGSETDPPLTDAVTAFLRNYDRKKPLFLAVSYHNPHDICFHPRKSGWVSENDSLLEIRYYGFKYRLPDPIGIPPNKLRNLPPLPFNFAISENEPEFLTEKRLHHESYGLETKLAYTYSDEEWQSYLNAYYRMTERVDSEIGILLNAISENGYDKNTVIVFTSDHGDGAAAHKWAAKNNLYDESAKVPLFIIYPEKIKKNQVNRNIVTLSDLVPTFCDYASINTELNFAGKSLRPVLEGKLSSLHKSVIVELADYKPDTTRLGRMVRTERFKYNYFTSGKNNEQFFDLINDPGEMRNLAYDPEFREEIESHRQILRDWIRDRGGNMKFE